MSFIPIPSRFYFREIPSGKDREIYFSGSDEHGYSISEYTQSSGSFPCEGAPYRQALGEFLHLMRTFYNVGTRLTLKTETCRLVFERVAVFNSYSLAIERDGKLEMLASRQPHDSVLPLLRSEFGAALVASRKFICTFGGDNELV